MIFVIIWVEYTHKVFIHIYIYVYMLAQTHIKLMYLQACTQRLVIKILQHSNGKQKV